jgi:2-keto-4-pentenoate hydratase/2-oxohepta-3-ene-1,7-dioic acid hydratase in catechol pathway
MKIICVGRNYVDHIKELSNDKPTDPVVFIKPDTALIEGSQPFYYPSFIWIVTLISVVTAIP